MTQWAKYFSHFLIKHDVPSDHWRIGLKNVLKKTVKLKKNISTLAWYRYGFLKKKVFLTHWATSFSHYLVKHDGPSDLWRIGLKNELKKDSKIEKTISTLVWYRYGFLKKRVLWPNEQHTFHISWSNMMSQVIIEGLD